MHVHWQLAVFAAVHHDKFPPGPPTTSACACVCASSCTQDTGYGRLPEEEMVRRQWGFKHSELWEQGLFSLVYIGGFTIFAMIGATIIRFVK